MDFTVKWCYCVLWKCWICSTRVSSSVYVNLCILFLNLCPLFRRCRLSEFPFDIALLIVKIFFCWIVGFFCFFNRFCRRKMSLKQSIDGQLRPPPRSNPPSVRGKIVARCTILGKFVNEGAIKINFLKVSHTFFGNWSQPGPDRWSTIRWWGFWGSTSSLEKLSEKFSNLGVGVGIKYG